jgi:hypothetical protein
MNVARLKIVALAFVVLFFLAQLVQPKRTNPPVVPSRSLEAHVQVPQNVLPISWLVTDDVNVGRSHINFQDWEAQENPKEATEHLALICKEVQGKGMPPFTYRIIHKESWLSAEDIDALCSWSQSFGTALETPGEHHH